MFKIFTLLADWIVYGIMGQSDATHWARSLHFFIEDTTKILVLLVVMIYIISWIRAGLNTEAVRDYLKGKHPLFGHFAAATFGAVTPFCSCSSIPLFLGFTSARIPIGITMSFLITSPMINEVAIGLLWSLLGWKFTVVYVVVGILSGVIGGIFLNAIKAERYLLDYIKEAIPNTGCCGEKNEAPEGQSLQLEKMTKPDRHIFAKRETKEIYGRVWKWVLLGVGVGALLHGFVPQSFFEAHLGSGNWWTVPVASVVGIPLYANATGMIPVAESLLGKGLPIGTTMTFMMSVVAASFPEFMMLKQVMKWRLLVIFFLLLLTLFTLSGWLFNYLEAIEVLKVTLHK